MLWYLNDDVRVTPQLSLPEGAFLRLGNGYMSGGFSIPRMVQCLRWGVVSVCGYMMPTRLKHFISSRGTRILSTALLLVLIVERLRVQRMPPFTYGT